MAADMVHPAEWNACTRCDVHAPTEQLLDAKGQLWCPTCAEAADVVRSNLREWLISIPVGIATAVALIVGDAPRISILVEVAVLCGVWFLLTIAHEMGHAIAGKLAGYGVVGIVFGSGRHRLARVRVAGVIVEVRRSVLAGGRMFPSGSGTAGRSVLLLVGGISAELLLLLPVLMWAPSAPLFELARIGFIAFITAHVLVNLWPMQVFFPGLGHVPNDGLLLLNAIRSRKGFSEHTSTRAEVALALLSETNTPDEQLAATQSFFQAAPDDLAVRYHYAGHLAYRGDWRRSIDMAEPLLEEKHAPEQRAYLLNTLAWSALMLHDKDMLDLANGWSRQAQELLPIAPYISSTRGSVLVMRGDYDEGMPLLLRAHKTCGDDPANKALVSGFAAIGAAGQGLGALAQNRYAAMIDGDPDCAIRSVVEQALGPELAHDGSLKSP